LFPKTFGEPEKEIKNGPLFAQPENLLEKQLVTFRGLGRTFTFENFAVSSSNQLAFCQRLNSG